MAIAENPDVSITLTGLLVFLFAPDKSSCQIGIISNPEHKLRIGVLKTTSTSAEPLALGDFSKGDIKIKVINPKTDGITLHTSNDFDGLENGDLNDFRWTPDLEGENFHKEKLPIIKDKISQIIHLDNGLLFSKSRSKVTFKLPDGSERTQFISELVGINIDFKDADSMLVFTYGPTGEDKLEMKRKEGTKYKIVILNDRPVHPIVAVANPAPAAEPHNHAAHAEEHHDHVDHAAPAEEHHGHVDHAAPAEEHHDHVDQAGHDDPEPVVIPPPVELDFKFYYEVFKVPDEKQLKMFSVPGGDTLGHPCGTGSGGKTGSFS